MFLKAELENVAKLEFRAKPEGEKKVKFRENKEYVTSNPALSDISQKLFRTIEKMEKFIKDKHEMNWENARDEAEALSSQGRLGLNRGEFGTEGYEGGVGGDEFELPRSDRFASATKDLIEQAHQLAELKGDGSSIFLRSDQSILNNQLFENFTKEMQHDMAVTPTKMKFIEESYLGDNFDTVQKRPPKKLEVGGQKLGNKLEFLNKQMSFEEIGTIICRKDVQKKRIKMEVRNSKVAEFCEVLKGKKINVSLLPKFNELRNTYYDVMERKRAEQIASSSAKNIGSKTESKQGMSGRSEPERGFEGGEMNDYNDGLDVIMETMREEVMTDPNVDYMNVNENWSRLGEMSELIRFLND